MTDPSSSTPASPPTEPSLAKLAANAKIKRTAWLEAYGVPISQEFAEFIEAIGLLIQAASVRAASTGTGWIPVEEKLPPRHQNVLCFNRDGEIFEGRICMGMHAPFFTYPRGFGSPSNTAPNWIDVTHWQPLPAPPVASQKGKEAGQ